MNATITGRMPRGSTTHREAEAPPLSPGAPAADLRAERPRESEYVPSRAIDARRAVRYQQHGAHDPTLTVANDVLWRVSRTPLGVATLALRISRARIRAAAWGPGAEWALDQLPRLCGAGDDPDGFDASRHPLIFDAHRRHGDLRLGATDLVFDDLASAIFEQKVTGLQAFGAWRVIVSRFGERAPGPTPRPMFAPPAQWRTIPSWAWHRAGLEPAQSRTVVASARRRASIETALDAAEGGDDRDRILTSLPGVGPWTSAETRIRAYGDPDAVSVGDYHLAHTVGYALTGSRVDDDGMLELLEPWRGHRQRVIRLIYAAGAVEPRRGPRLHPEDHRDR